jgi:leucyl aminopeptidase
MIMHGCGGRDPLTSPVPANENPEPELAAIIGEKLKFSVRISSPAQVRADCLVVPVGPKAATPEFRALDRKTGGLLGRRVSAGDLGPDRKRIVVLPEVQGVAARRVMLVGTGKEPPDRAGWRKAIAGAARELQALGARQAALWLAAAPAKDPDRRFLARHAVEAMEDSGYRFAQLKSENRNGGPSLARVILLAADGAGRDALRAGARDGAAVSAGMNLARDLGNLPGNICTPGYLADRARALGRRYRWRVRVLERAAMERLGMGALLSVARGSRQPPKLIVVEYRRGRRVERPVALVGKGLTFDAGGISIKPADKMDEMKFDMCGAASVLGALVAASELALPLNVVAVIPCSENLPDGAANKPGDIVTSMSGRTIEVLNTDAEGRLILCDALTYSERFRPQAVVDVATLTGACVIALGAHASGLLANDQALAEELLRAGNRSLDRCWQLPLWEDYQPQLDSNFADLANVGGREAGTITGACFLARFTKKFKWAHLDIAGTAWRSGKEKGATGRVVPLLTQFLIDRAGRA